MLGPVDHVGYLALDWEQAIENLGQVLGLSITRRFERPEFSLIGGYLGSEPGSVEVFSFSDQTLSSRRLGGATLRLDHVGFLVEDIEAVAIGMRRVGIRFAGPDLRQEVVQPIELSGVRHLWTVPSSSLEQCIQLVER